MVKLNQIIAVVAGKKTRAIKLLTESHRGWNKEAIAGISKTYTPKDENGDKLPAENKTIHLDVPTKVRETMAQIADFWDVVISQDKGNTVAKATVEVNGKTFLEDMPVTCLLFLEKQLVDLHTFVSNLPILPPDRVWKWDGNRNCYVTDPIGTIRSMKVPTVIVKYKPTTEHPAQTELINQDETVGTWNTTYMSSAIPSAEKADMLSRVEALQDAMKAARAAANSVEIEQVHMGAKILQHVFGDKLMKKNEG